VVRGAGEGCLVVSLSSEEYPVVRSKQGEAKDKKEANGRCCIEVINSVTSATIVPLQAG